jgi:2-polyprenyl-6-hydroxyphenyl methylase/3-demethylubiquinone-9 3-methyltransferase
MNRARGALAERSYWDALYAGPGAPSASIWRPRSNEHRLIAGWLERWLPRGADRRVLEVGCGDSPWLPWIAQVRGTQVAGLDYSPAGCAKARGRLAAAGVPGTVVCADLFADGVAHAGYDAVLSLGVVEHFTGTAHALARIARLTRPGGLVLTIVPNLRSVHGLLMAAWQPRILRRHRLLGLSQLTAAHRALGLEILAAGALGAASCDLLSWGVEARWPRLERTLWPLIGVARRGADAVFRRLPQPGIPGLAPFLQVVARRPGAAP